ncbi:MAG TPA: SufD family Fe-S cluster assembly protein, partial [Acidimicrobiales bacterium]
MPSAEEEVWRYSRIAELDMDEFAPVLEPSSSAGLLSSLQPLLDAVGERAGLVLSVNGHLSEVEPVGGRVELRGAAEMPEGEELLSRADAPSDAFGHLNAAFQADGIVLRVPSGVVVEKPVVILHWIDAEGGAVFPHTVVQAGEASQVTVVEVLASPEDVRALVAPVVALDAHPAANLRYLNVQQFGSRVWQFAYQGSHVDRDATLHSSMVALGGEYARVRADSRLVGQGATSNLLAVYFGDGRQMHDFRTMQDHDAPKTTSDLLFKGAVEDSAESVYTGLIRVKKGAAGTRAFQTNRNLVLS